MVISIRGFSMILGIFMVKILSLKVSLAFSIFILPSIFRYNPEIFIWGIATDKKQCGLPGWLSSKESACNAGDERDTASIPWSERSPGVGNDNPVHYSCLENFKEIGAWRARLFADPMDCSPLGSSLHGILQKRILERVAMPSSRGSL